MFTGIIARTGTVLAAAKRNGSVHVRLARPAGWKIKTGESVNIDGICSTVKRLGRNSFEVEYMPETIQKTTAGNFAKGTIVNMERSLRFGDRLGGHLVQGHVDTAGVVREMKQRGDSVMMSVGFPKRYAKFFAAKGSVCMNGVSLTVVSAATDRLAVSLVSYTLRRTNLRNLKKGDKVNLEVDAIARYLDALRHAKKRS